MLSFHATKVFNTFEGGAIVCPDAKTKQRIDFLKNFGFADEVTVVAPGINGKMNEFQAALGLLQLTKVDQPPSRAAARSTPPTASVLAAVPGIHPAASSTRHRAQRRLFPYSGRARLPRFRGTSCTTAARRKHPGATLFLPLDQRSAHVPWAALGCTRSVCRWRRSVSQRILCLPIYPDLAVDDQQRVIDIIAG
jgi:dTDP-4-amino-4,6-dideoxygalactose transaminase